MAIIASVLAVKSSDGDVATYEEVKEQLFFIGNDIRNDPEGVMEEAGVDSDVYSWLES